MAQFDIAATYALPPALHAAVPLYIFELYERGKQGIQPWEVEGACTFGHELASKGDQLLFPKKGETSRLFAGLVKALAIAAVMTPGGVAGKFFRFDEPQLLSACYGEEEARAWITAQLQHYQEAVSQVATVPVSVRACAQEEWLGTWNAAPWLRVAQNQELRLLLVEYHLLDQASKSAQAPMRTLCEEVACQARLGKQQTMMQALHEISARVLSHYQQPCIWSLDRGKAEQWLKLFRHEEVTGEAWIKE